MSKILGLDLGTNSIGWANIDDSKNQIIGMGSRIFQEGVIDMGKGEGKEMSRSASRTAARGARRQAYRRRMRKNILLRLLAQNDMCPIHPNKLRNEALQKHFPFEDLDQWFKLNPYELRAKALEEKISLEELGRIFYHLIQRRGFQSNSRSAGSDENETGAIFKGDNKSGKVGITETTENIEGHKTLGAYLNSIKPVEGKTYEPRLPRIRNRYTTRQMYIDEFNAIWESQQKFHDELTPELRQKIGGLNSQSEKNGVLFHQRALRSQKGLVGKCSFEPNKTKIPKSHFLFEEFRILQWVNTVDCNNKRISSEEREILIEELLSKQKVKFSALRKKLKKHGAEFQFNYKDDDQIVGSETISALSNKKFFGKEWFEFSDKMQEDIWHALYFFDDRAKLKEYAIERWNFDEEKAEKISRFNLKDGYANLSRKAINNILPFLRAGNIYNIAVVLGGVKNAIGSQTYDQLSPAEEMELVSKVEKIVYARKKGGFIEDLKTMLKSDYNLSVKQVHKLYHHSAEVNVEEVLDKLPMGLKGDKLITSIRNPIVVTALFELRKVVNAIIDEWGKPDEIKIELARDLKVSKSKRQAIRKEQKRLEDENDRVKKLLTEIGQRHSHNNILKYKLWEECNNVCPFTGKQIPLSKLFDAEIQIEHIHPWSRSLNDSFGNKTLCYADENRKKGNRTPFEFYGNNEAQWEEVKQRALKLFKNSKEYPNAYNKFKHFVKKKFDDDFAAKQLNDTRYISVAAKKYMSLICEKVNVLPGQATAKLRHHWGLNGILNSENKKSRDDHRHHAVDALTVACSKTKYFQELTEFNAHKKDRTKSFPLPWDGFVAEATQKVNEILVSHRKQRKVLNRRMSITEKNGKTFKNLGLEARGPLHKETVFGKRKNYTEEEAFHVRKPIESLETQKQIDKVVDPAIRKVILARVELMGGFDQKGKVPKNCFVENDENGNPKPTVFLKNKNGKPVPVLKVRIRENIGRAERLKMSTNQFVNPQNNHHVLIYMDFDNNMKEDVVTFWTAAERVKQGLPVVQLPEDGKEIHTTMQINDMFILGVDNIDSLTPLEINRHLFRVQKFTSGDYYFRKHIESTRDGKLGEAFQYIKGFGSGKTGWKTFNPIKASINCIGQLKP